MIEGKVFMFDLLEKAGDFIGNVADKVAPYIPGLASGAATVAGYLGQQETNAVNRQIASENTQFQERMSNTAYQRQVKDMEAAGLNPMLAYLKGGGASTPTGSITQIQNPYTAGISSGYQSSQMSLANKQVPKVGAETENIGAQTVKARADTLLALANKELSFASADEKRAHISLMETQSKKIAEETKNIPIEGDRLVAVIKQLHSSVKLIDAQTLTEEQRKLQMFQLGLKTLYEADLLSLDVEAVQKADNLGREFGQYKPLVDTVMSIIRMLKR